MLENFLVNVLSGLVVYMITRYIEIRNYRW